MKKAIMILLGILPFALLFTASFAFSLGVGGEGFRKVFEKVDSGEYGYVKSMVTVFAALFFIGIFTCFYLATKLEWISEHESKCDEIDKEAAKYKQATEALIKNFKIQSADIL